MNIQAHFVLLCSGDTVLFINIEAILAHQQKNYDSMRASIFFFSNIFKLRYKHFIIYYATAYKDYYTVST